MIILMTSFACRCLKFLEKESNFNFRLFYQAYQLKGGTLPKRQPVIPAVFCSG